MRRSNGLVVFSAFALWVFIAASGASNALRKGGDATDFLEGGSRVLHRLPLYEGSSPAEGFIGPPCQAVMFIPFTALSERNETAARLSWFALNLLMLGAGVAWWSRAFTTLTEGEPVPTGSVLAALLAISLPLQTNFEHQNMNPLLLGLLGVGAWALTRGHDRAAGLSIGAAAALKIFPSLLIVYLALRRRWTACLAAVGTFVVLSSLPVIVYGPADLVSLVRSWIRVSSGWPSRFNNQSLISAIDRLTGAWNGPGIRTAAEAPLVAAIFVSAACILIASAAYVFSRGEDGRRLVPIELTATVLLSVVLSPIAWDHYWVLLFPAFLALRCAARPDLLGRTATVAFWTAAILVSGISRMTVGVYAWNVARRLSVSTIAALLLFWALLRLHRAVASEISSGSHQA